MKIESMSNHLLRPAAPMDNFSRKFETGGVDEIECCLRRLTKLRR